LIRGPWTWWLGGQQQNRVVKGTTVDYMLYPAWLGVKVHEVMQLPQPFGQAPGVVIRIDFLPDNGSFASGRGYFLIEPTSTPGVTRLIGRFAGVKSLVLPHSFFAETHLKGERGHLFGGLLKAGWFHLILVAEGKETLPTGYHLFTPPEAAKP